MPIIDVDGDKLHFFESGSGTPIIFVHGSCGGGRQWRALSDELSKDYRCLSLDLFGSGASETWPLERDWTPLEDERAIGAVLDLLGEPAHLIVHSGGGEFAYPTIKNRREDIISLTMFEPVYFHLLRQENNPLYAEPEGMADQFHAAIDNNDLETAMTSFVDVWANRQGTWAGLPEAVKAMMKQGSNRLYHEWNNLKGDEPTQSELAQIDIPVLLFLGDKTIPSMHRVVEIIRHSIPNCRYFEIEGAGHLSPFTHPKVALPIIDGFLAELSA